MSEGTDMDAKPVECQLCRIGKYPYFSYSGSGACDHCGAVWTYDEGDMLTEDSLRRLWEKVPRWIPVSERLPEASTEVLVAWSLPGGGQQVDAALIFDNGMWAATVGHSIGRVTHWMPLPEPPEVK